MKSFKGYIDKSYRILPDKDKSVKNIAPNTSKPIHVQRVEKALNLNYFLKKINHALEDSSSDSDDEACPMNAKDLEGILKEADFISTTDYFNLDNVSPNRKWLADIMQENTQSIPEDVQYQHILKLHAYQNKVRSELQNTNNYIYYGAGLLSTIDKYPEIEKSLPSPSLKRKHTDTSKSPLYPPDILDEISEGPCLDLNLENGMDFQNYDEDSSNITCEYTTNMPPIVSFPSGPKRKGKKFKDDETKRKWEDMMTIKRKKLLMNIVKKEIGKQHRSKINKHKELLIQCKRVAQHCAKVVRQKAVQSARIVKEQQWRMKRLSRENIAYWKRSRRLDREVKKRLEKEAEEQRKIDHELVEAKRQQRKLNFLITQTELYAHFMSKKLGTASPEEQLRILSQLDEEKNPRLMSIDEYDCDVMKEKAKRNVNDAFQSEKARTKHFDLEANSCLMDNIEPIDGEQPQPNNFRGLLKGYQLRGMNWLANLYSQGISGILADEMGLGKTVQSIAFLCHIAEKYAVWGPFLIISPASTLHNWQQEIAKFVPSFKVVPYWGNPNERKILRQFWDQKDIYTKDASFHIVVTSYQIVITDIKYFNRIKWQYMILDEAQAIKSTSSMRWKTLLGFSCRNRLLLSGTPIQNSMAELWALLHFIMPTLFDSHEEFNEWFSKDIESHAENKTGIDEKHLSRLHMILKPFMLRRIKKDVENELSDKIEIMVYCPLTTRQKLLYIALKQKIKIEDLIHYSVGGGDAHTVDKNFTSNLMNLVMQFRKVCNHPELFERRDAKSPIRLMSVTYQVPYLIYDFNVRMNLLKKLQKYFLFSAEYIAHAYMNDFRDTIFNFCLALHLSFEDIHSILQGNILERWKHYFHSESKQYLQQVGEFWHPGLIAAKPSVNINNQIRCSQFDINTSNVFSDLIFTRNNVARRVIYSHSIHTYHFMPESVEHKIIRSKNVNTTIEEETIIDVVSEDFGGEEMMKISTMNVADFDYKHRSSYTRKNSPCVIPSFLFSGTPKINSNAVDFYCSSRRAAWDYRRHSEDFSYNSLNYYWSESTKHPYKCNSAQFLHPQPDNALDTLRPINGWSHISIPDKETLVTDAGKLSVLDNLLRKLKEDGHRVLIYSQMTKMIDLLEEYMWHRHHKYMRLDGSSKISERRDMVADFQARTDIFVFLLSTRAGGLGINLTAADTVIFYDSDWNPTVDQQAMDRAHRLGQTKQVTVYRLICKGSIEERILQRAREKSEIQKLVISGGNFKPDTLKPKEVVSLLLDEDELIQKVKPPGKIEYGKVSEEDRKRKHVMPYKTIPAVPELKKVKTEPSSQESGYEEQWINMDSGPSSPHSINSPDVLTDDLSDASFLDEGDTSISNKYTVYNVYGTTVKPRIPGRGTAKRGRPRGSRRAANMTRMNSAPPTTSTGISNASELSISDTSLVSSSSLNTNFLDIGTSGGVSPVPAIRRGPGRPRLKPSGPSNAGSRGVYRHRKPTKPLPVPLPSDGNNVSSTSNSFSYSNYIYDFPEHSDS